jgi:hypothetical protein
MPGQTPILGIRYPLIGETVDATSFANFANDVNSAVVTTQALATGAVNRKECLVPIVIGQSVTVAVETTLTFTNIETAPAFAPFRDNDNMFNPGSPTQITINTSGVYMVVSRDLCIDTFTTMISIRNLIYKNGIAQFGERRNEQNGSTTSMVETVQALLRCEVGDIITNRVLWNGTGGPGAVGNFTFPGFQVYRICPL